MRLCAAVRAGEVFYVKFHLKTNQGIKNLDADRAAELAGTDPDYATRDLFEAIKRGDYPSWTLCMQASAAEKNAPDAMTGLT